MRVHNVKSWVFTKEGALGGIAYSQSTALDRLAEGYDIAFEWQRRVCVVDRVDYDAAIDGECYLCKRERESVSV